MKHFLFILLALNVFLCATAKYYFPRRDLGGINYSRMKNPGIKPLGDLSGDDYDYSSDDDYYSRDDDHYSRDDDHYSRDDDYYSRDADHYGRDAGFFYGP